MKAYGARGRKVLGNCPCCRHDGVKPSRTKENREAFRDEERAGTWPEHPAEVDLLDCDAGNCPHNCKQDT